MDDPGKPTKKSGVPLEDIIAPLVFIVVTWGAIAIWRWLVGAPLWLAIVLGIPTGYVVVMGGAWWLSRSK